MQDSRRDTDVKNRVLDSGRNMYVIICETNCKSRFDALGRVLRAGALG